MKNLICLAGVVFLLSGCSAQWGWYVVDPSTDSGWINLRFMLSGLYYTILLSLTAIVISVVVGLLVALPGLSNLWMILLKATPLLFLLGIEDVVYWARELGGAKTSRFAYPHPDWRLGYFLVLLVFYLFLTWVSEKVFDRLKLRFGAGVAA